jgi:hypothetical protein
MARMIALHLLLVLGELRLEDLESNGLAVVGVAGAEDGAGGAASDEALEGEVRQGLADEVAEVAGAGGLGRGRLRGRLGDGAELKAQLAGADADDVAGLEVVLGDGLAVDQGAAGADVDDHGLAAVPLDLAVDARGGGVGQAGGGGLAVADLEGLAFEQGEGTPAIGAADDDEHRGHLPDLVESMAYPRSFQQSRRTFNPLRTKTVPLPSRCCPSATAVHRPSPFSRRAGCPQRGGAGGRQSVTARRDQAEAGGPKGLPSST